jgi:hypothetical protein
MEASLLYIAGAMLLGMGAMGAARHRSSTRTTTNATYAVLHCNGSC